jgi:hypothetical protein
MQVYSLFLVSHQYLQGFFSTKKLEMLLLLLKHILLMLKIGQLLVASLWTKKTHLIQVKKHNLMCFLYHQHNHPNYYHKTQSTLQ